MNPSPARHDRHDRHDRQSRSGASMPTEAERLHARVSRLGAAMFVGGALLALATGTIAVLLYGHLERITRAVARLESRLDDAGRPPDHVDDAPPQPETTPAMSLAPSSVEAASDRHPVAPQPTDTPSRPPRRPVEAVASTSPRQPEDGLWDATPAMPDLDTRALAIESFQQGRYAECANIAVRLLRQSPEDGELRLLLGRAQLAVDALADAAATFEQAVSLNPESAEAWRQWGLTLLRMLKPADAVFRLETAAQLDAADARIRFELGVAQTNAGNIHDAIESLNKAVSLDPSFAEPHMARGICLLGLGKSDEANAAFARALDLDKELGTAIDRARDAAARPPHDAAGVLSTASRTPNAARP